MDVDAPTTRERIQMIVAAPVVVAASLAIVLSRPEPEAPPVDGGRPGAFAAPTFGTEAAPMEVTRSPESNGAQDIRVVYVVNQQQVDGTWRNLQKVVVTGTIEADERSTEVEPEGLDDLPSAGAFEIGAVVEWFEGSTRLGWKSVGLSDPTHAVS